MQTIASLPFGLQESRFMLLLSILFDLRSDSLFWFVKHQKELKVDFLKLSTESYVHEACQICTGQPGEPGCAVEYIETYNDSAISFKISVIHACRMVYIFKIDASEDEGNRKDYDLCAKYKDVSYHDALIKWK